MLPAPILAFAAIDTCARLRRWLHGRATTITTYALPAAAAATSLVLTLVFIRPQAEVTTYLPDSRVAQIQACLAAIPADASVAASNTLVPHLSHRDVIYVISLRSDADYIAVDPSTYPNFFHGEEDQRRRVCERHDPRAGADGLAAAADAGASAVAGGSVLGACLLRNLDAGRGQGRAAGRDHLEVEPHPARLVTAYERCDSKRPRRGGRELKARRLSLVEAAPGIRGGPRGIDGCGVVSVPHHRAGIGDGAVVLALDGDLPADRHRQHHRPARIPVVVELVVGGRMARDERHDRGARAVVDMNVLSGIRWRARPGALDGVAGARRNQDTCD